MMMSSYGLSIADENGKRQVVRVIVCKVDRHEEAKEAVSTYRPKPWLIITKD